LDNGQAQERSLRALSLLSAWAIHPNDAGDWDAYYWILLDIIGIVICLFYDHYG
jgi:hypothetical protein